MGDILGIRFEAIRFIFDIYQIEDMDRQDLFEKIITIDSVRLGMMRDDMKKNMKKTPKK